MASPHGFAPTSRAAAPGWAFLAALAGVALTAGLLAACSAGADIDAADAAGSSPGADVASPGQDSQAADTPAIDSLQADAGVDSEACARSADVAEAGADALADSDPATPADSGATPEDGLLPDAEDLDTLPADVEDGANLDGPQDASVDGPTLCFQTLPGSDAWAVELAQPDAAACGLQPNMLGWTVFADTDSGPAQTGKPLGPPTLVIEVGSATKAAGQFVPYVDGQWVPMTHGVQGGTHVWAAFRVGLPGIGGAKLLLDAKGRSWMDCQLVASSFEDYAIAYPDGSGAEQWTNATAVKPGLTVAFADKEVEPYCGKWIVLVVEVRERTTNAWGRKELTLRLYDEPIAP